MRAPTLIERDPEKLGGTLVFAGTRVPIKNLFDCLAGGESLEEFLDQFPTRNTRASVGRIRSVAESIAGRG